MRDSARLAEASDYTDRYATALTPRITMTEVLTVVLSFNPEPSEAPASPHGGAAIAAKMVARPETALAERRAKSATRL